MILFVVPYELNFKFVTLMTLLLMKNKNSNNKEQLILKNIFENVNKFLLES